MKQKSYCVRPGIVFRKEGKTGLIYDPETGKIDMLNETGAFIWKLCNGKNSPQDINRKVLKVFSGNKAAISKQIRVFIKQNIKEKCIEVRP